MLPQDDLDPQLLLQSVDLSARLSLVWRRCACARAAGAGRGTEPSRESRVTLDGRRGRQEVEGAKVAGSRRAHKQNEATQQGEVNRRCFPSAAAAMAARATATGGWQTCV